VFSVDVFSFFEVKYTASIAIIIPVNLKIPKFSLKKNIPKSIGIIIAILLDTEATEMPLACVVFPNILKTQMNMNPKYIEPNSQGAFTKL
jgi:hypothetical protein